MIIASEKNIILLKTKDLLIKIKLAPISKKTKMKKKPNFLFDIIVHLIQIE
mgnify:CR=1 FL=1